MRVLQARAHHPVRSRFNLLSLPTKRHGSQLRAVSAPAGAVLPGVRGARLERRERDPQAAV